MMNSATVTKEMEQAQFPFYYTNVLIYKCLVVYQKFKVFQPPFRFAAKIYTSLVYRETALFGLVCVTFPVVCICVPKVGMFGKEFASSVTVRPMKCITEDTESETYQIL